MRWAIDAVAGSIASLLSIRDLLQQVGWFARTHASGRFFRFVRRNASRRYF
jgi:hypothetical protein